MGYCQSSTLVVAFSSILTRSALGRALAARRFVAVGAVARRETRPMSADWRRLRDGVRSLCGVLRARRARARWEGDLARREATVARREEELSRRELEQIKIGAEAFARGWDAGTQDEARLRHGGT